MTEHDNTIFGQLVASPTEAQRHRAKPCILSPMMVRLPPQLADLGSSLPIGDVNGELLESLREEALPKETYTGVLANDPFRLPDDLLEMLARLGCYGVASWPSTAMLSGELAEALTHSGLGYEGEMNFLTRARERGFRTLAVVSREEQLPLALSAQPSRLMIAAGLETMASITEAQQRLLALAERVRAEHGDVWTYEHSGVAEIMAVLRPYASRVIRHPSDW